MINERIDLWENGEYTYRAAYGFQPNIRTYIHEDAGNRPNLLVVPGGAYCMVCPPESEFIAKEFYNRGMNTFVLSYTTDITTAVPLNRQPLEDLSRAVRVIRKLMAERTGTQEKTYVAGFSAGGHLTGSLATHYMDVEETNEKYRDFTNRPDAVILGYPVISFTKYVEAFSMLTLVGPEPTPETVDYFSLEKAVTDQTVPCFVWHTAEDSLVPVQNSLMFAEALKEHGVKFELHIFSHGDHGLCLPNETFFSGKFGGEFVMEQLGMSVAAVKNGTAVDITEKRTEELKVQFAERPREPQEGAEAPKVDLKEFEDIRQWPDMACRFLSRL